VPERVHPPRLARQDPHGLRPVLGVEVAQHHGWQGAPFRAHDRGHRARVTGHAGGVGRIDRQQPGGRLELRPDEHADVEGTPAWRELVGRPAHDRKAAQERRPLVEARNRANAPAQGRAPQRTIRGGRPDVAVSQLSREPSGHVTPPPAGRRLLKSDDVRIEGPQALDDERETLLEGVVVAVQLREDAPVEEVERDEPQREGRGRRIERDRARGSGQDPQRPAGDDQRAADPRHGTRSGD